MSKVISNNILTILSLSLVLFLLGLYLLLLTQSSHITNRLKENINIVVELVEQPSETEKNQLNERLKSNEGVIASSVEFLTKEDAKQIMIGEDQVGFLDDSEQNPFRDAFIFNLHASNYNKDFIERFSEVLENEPIVNEVFYQEDLFSVVNSNLKKFSLIVLIVGVFMLLLAILLIYNTVNLSLLTDKQKIQTMELVGADRGYIKRPYIWSSIKMGLLSFGIAALLIIGFVSLVVLNFESIREIFNIFNLLAILLVILLISLLIPYLSTNKFVIRHLNKI